MRENAACRSCGQSPLVEILDLGTTPLANALLTEDQLLQPEDRFPLDLAWCPSCTLVQITETVPPERLFREYLYFSSFSDTMLAHARGLTEELVAKRGLGPSSLVMEIASNDGYLLQNYAKAGIPVLGIEPAVNIAKVAREQRGIPTLSEFFGAKLAERLRREGRMADVVHAHNVLAHVADLNGLVRGIRTVLKDNGVAVIEAPYAVEMFERCEFDTIYHEHLCYFSLTSLVHLFKRNGLDIVDVERIPIHGGSLRTTAASSDAGMKPTARVGAMLDDEKRAGMLTPEYYLSFARQVEDLRGSLLKLLRELKQQGRRIAAYGAAAKGSTLLNCFGINRDLVDFVVDRSTYKQGRFMPGVHQPIHPPARLLEEQPDYVLLLTWNFKDEILAQQTEYRRRGGRFIVPVPTPQVA
jgi:SAM-dependent methyltransferase